MLLLRYNHLNPYRLVAPLILYWSFRMFYSVAFFWWTGFAAVNWFFHDVFYERNDSTVLCLVVISDLSLFYRQYEPEHYDAELKLKSKQFRDRYPRQIIYSSFAIILLSVNSQIWAIIATLSSAGLLFLIRFIYMLIWQKPINMKQKVARLSTLPNELVESPMLSSASSAISLDSPLRQRFPQSIYHRPQSVFTYTNVSQYQHEILKSNAYQLQQRQLSSSAQFSWKLFHLLGLLLLSFSIYWLSVNRITTQQSWQQKELVRGFKLEYERLLSVVIMTNHRDGDPDYLLRTLESYDAKLISSNLSDPLFNRVEIIVYTSSTADEHLIFNIAALKYQDRSDFRFISRQESNVPEQTRFTSKYLKQRLDFADGIHYALNQSDSYLIMLAEDDMPLCSYFRQQFRSLIHHAFVVGDHCGAFIGTGGSGILMTRPTALNIVKLLRSKDYLSRPVDILIQQCLRGHLPQCSNCVDPRTPNSLPWLYEQQPRGLLASSTLYMYHIGFDSSTFRGRRYGADAFQCGWRHPFNGHSGLKVYNYNRNRVDG
ncbi:hypothetical protein MIR68_010768 [Amoeboaphelidium protococcarum]|nr:hypothetical protein MIR68_010768 [Amoeboaphelidium protococcarum]